MAPLVSTQIPFAKACWNSIENGFETVDGSVSTAFAFVAGVPVQLALARSNSFIVALATSVVTVILRSVPAVAFTAVVAADVMTVALDGGSCEPLFELLTSPRLETASSTKIKNRACQTFTAATPW